MGTLPLRSVQDLQAAQLDKPMYTCTGKDLELERCHSSSQTWEYQSYV